MLRLPGFDQHLVVTTPEKPAATSVGHVDFENKRNVWGQLGYLRYNDVVAATCGGVHVDA